jgi:hypothetical protein
VVVQKVITVAIACFTTVAIGLATLVVSIIGPLMAVIRMAVIRTIVVMIRRNDASRGQQAADHESEKRKPHDKAHGFNPLSSMT